MAEETILFPSAPLLLVDRSWQRRGKFARTSKAYVGSSRVPDLTITKMAATATRSRKRSVAQGDFAHPAKRQSRHTRLQFFEYKPPVSSKVKRNKNASLDSGPEYHGHGTERAQEPFLSPETSHESESVEMVHSAVQSPVFRSPLSNSTGALYAIIDSEVQTFQSYLGYCTWITQQRRPSHPLNANIDHPQIHLVSPVPSIP